MSHPTIKMAPGADIKVIIQRLTELGATFLDLLRSMPSVQINRARPCCEIPETECPPHCVCDLHWVAQQGQAVQANVLVTNTGSTTRTFSFAATPFEGPGNPADTIQLAPNNATLAPNDSINVAASLTVTHDFQPGAQYKAEIRVSGAYEQAVCLTLNVPSCCGFWQSSCIYQCCHVRAGDPPTRIRAHQWYDHFQCEELCAPTQRSRS